MRLFLVISLIALFPDSSCQQARIKAINTFFAKNGYRSMDSSLYAQQSQSQSQYSSPLYMQHVYPQQQYPVYGIVPPTWTPSPTPYFETPLVRNATPTLHISRLLPGVIGIECIKCEVYNKA